MPKKKKHDNNYVQTFTKVWVRRLLILLCMWVTWTYILATVAILMQLDSVAIQYIVDMSNTAMQIILGVIVAYLCKSFFETKEEEKIRLQENEVNESRGENKWL